MIEKKLVGSTFCRVICHDLSHGCRWPICRCLCLCLCLCPLPQLAPLAVCCQDKRHNFYAVFLPFPTGTKRQVSHVADVGVWPMGDALLLLLLLHVAAAQIVCAASEKFAGNKVIYLILVYFILLPLPLPFPCLHYFLAIWLLKLATVAQQLVPHWIHLPPSLQHCCTFHLNLC